MAMRTLGIGPAGTLLAAGVMTVEDRLVLADFGAAEADVAMADVITEALRIDLLQSRAFALVDVSDMQQVLARMQHPAGERLTAARAREAALREGYKLVLDGEVGRLGSGWVLTARLTTAETGATIAAFRQTAASDEELLGAVDRLSSAIRAKVGESLRSVNAREPLERVTTTSLEALQRYTLAERIASGREPADGRSEIEIMLEAIALDSTFAMAHRKAGAWLSNARARTEALEAFRAAYRHRARLPEQERRLAEGLYFGQVVGDRWAASDANRRVLELDPNDKSALNNITADYLLTGRHEQAVEAGLRGIAQPYRYHSQFSNLALAYIRMGRWDEAQAMADSMLAEFEGSRNGWMRSIETQYGRRDLQRADSLATQAIGMGEGVSLRRFEAQTHRASLRAVQGRARAAIDDMNQLVSLTRELPVRYPALIAAVRAAQLELALRGNAAGSLRMLQRALAEFPPDSMPPADAPVLDVAMVFASAGDVAAAEGWLARADELRAPEANRKELDYQLVRARLLLNGGRAGDAVTLLERAGREHFCRECVAAPLAEAFEMLREHDAAIAQYRLVIGSWYLPDGALYLAPAHFRLAELLEARGEVAGAAEHYAEFVRLRRDADAELQPQVRAAEQRLAALRGRG
jgi:eukaryotic-like serine/threonine-protein kinase